MFRSSLNRILFIIVLSAMLIPLGIGEVIAIESSYSNVPDQTTSSRSGLDRGSISESEEVTVDLPQILPADIGPLDFGSISNLHMESKSITFLGKDPNSALDFSNSFQVSKSSRGTRDEPADNNANGANVMTHNMALRNDTLDGTSDQVDWYSVVLTTTTNSHDEVEIEISNKETTVGRNITVIFFDNFNGYPLVNWRQWAYNTPGGTIMPGGLPANTTKTLIARAPSSGTYYMVIAAPQTGSFSYSVNSVKITGKTAIDHNNEWEKASIEQNTNFFGALKQNTNHWNWHNVSSHFANTGVDYDNNLSYTMTITAEGTGDIEELNSAGTFTYVTWTMVSMMYNDDDDNWFLYHHQFWTGGSRVLRFGNNGFNPERGWSIVNGTLAYIGVECKSAFIWLDGNNDVHVDDWYATGNSQYSMQIAVEELDLNHKPQLNFGKVTPTHGPVTDNFTFEAKFTDLNNEAPVEIKVIVDDDIEFGMEAAPGEGTNYDDGVVFQVKVRGDAIGDDPYPHSYRFYADDGRKIAQGDITTHTDLYIYENAPPIPHPDRETDHVMDEDQEADFIDLYTLFKDPDGDTDVVNDLDGNTLDFALWDGVGDKAISKSWGTDYLDEFVQVTLYETGPDKDKIMIRPLENQYGNSKITMKATDESQYGSDNYEWEVEVELDITVNPVNDAPVLRGIPDYTKVGAGAVNQDDIWKFTFNASDVDNPVLMYSTDIEEVLTIGGEDVLTTDPQDYGYSFDAFTGEITLTPSNEFVGIHTINVTVADNDMTNPMYDYDTFQIEILNVNDPPTITAIDRKDVIPGTALVFNAKQGQKLELQVHAEDPDLDIGEADVLKYRIDDERDNLYIDELKGELFFLPNQNDVDNRTTYITVTVYDSKKAEDSAELRIKVDNVNDPPRADGIEVIIDDADIATPQLENLTIKFKVMNPVDPDGDAMSYAWDFDTSENLDLIGGADDDNELQGLENIIHRYPHQGTFNGILTIRDAVGATVKISFNVSVIEPKTVYVPPVKDDKTDTDSGIGNLGKAGGVDIALWIMLLVVIIVITLVAVMFMIRKKKGEIEQMRHAERFRQEDTGDAELEAAGGLPGVGDKPRFPEETQQARSASELYGSDTGAAMPSLFDISPQQQQGLPPAGGPMPPQQPQPLGLPPAAPQVQPGAQPGAAQPQQPAATGDMKCTSCQTPINADWYICPGCHRFLK